AHQQLSVVLWNMTLGPALARPGVVGVIMIVACFYLWFFLSKADPATVVSHISMLTTPQPLPFWCAWREPVPCCTRCDSRGSSHSPSLQSSGGGLLCRSHSMHCWKSRKT